MRTLTYTFLLLAIAGLLCGHVGATLLSLLWAGVCYWGEHTMDGRALVDTEQELIASISAVMSAMTEDSV